MIKRLCTALCALYLLTGAGWAQSTGGELKGTIQDETGEPVPFAHVLIKSGTALVSGGISTIDGVYYIRNIPPGEYTVEVSATGFLLFTAKNVPINNNNLRQLDVKLSQDIVTLIDYTLDGGAKTLPIGEIENKVVFTQKTIYKQIDRSIEGAAKHSGSGTVVDGRLSNIGGGRNGALIIVDGEKAPRGLTVSPFVTQEVEVIAGTISADVGDATGGIIRITTRPIYDSYFGTVEARTSTMLDAYDNTLFNIGFGGPLVYKYAKKDTQKLAKRPFLGFYTSVEGNYERDPRPMAGGVWRLKNDVRDRIREEPLRLLPGGTGALLNSEFLRDSDMENVATRNNTSAYELLFSGKLDFLFSLNDHLTISTNGQLNRNQLQPDGSFSLLNDGRYGLRDGSEWNVNMRYVHHFKSKDSSLFQNASFVLQAGYLRGDRKIYDAFHENRVFDYGYVGKFEALQSPTFVYGYDQNAGLSGQLFQGYRDTLIQFTPGTANPDMAAITNQYFQLFNQTGGYYDQLPNIQAGGGLLNGQLPRTVYNIWSQTGTPYNTYGYSDFNQFRFTGSFSTLIKNHDVRVGFEFEKRTDNNYALNPAALWTVARLKTNSHLGTIDTANPLPGQFGNSGIYNDTIYYPSLYIADPNRPGFGLGQSYFDYSLRQKLGLATNGTDRIQVDALDPSLLELGLFSADDLLNQGSPLVSYYGYDYTGRKLSGNPGFEAFFTQRDAQGNYTRPIGSFEPVYMAGYIMDKFSVNDLHFSAGLRLDLFDANQKVLKDRYSLYETRTAGEVSVLGDQQVNHPTNIGEHYVVYVNDAQNPTEIKGYRNGDTWYNALGEEINDSRVLQTASGRVQPYLVNAQDNIQTPGFNPVNAFTDYRPQINVMPRLGFSFKLSPDAVFTAHYDILTQRPFDGVRLNPLDYFFWDNTTYNSGGRVFNNPNLRPEKITDFSVGFRQNLTTNSTLKITAFYRELRDMVAVVRINDAYPRTYLTWDNIDFGTVKGLSAQYNLTVKNNLMVLATYTLQFADGTGSDNLSQLNLVNSNQPNLRTTIPTNYDRRHNFTLFGVFDFGADDTYLGPRVLEKGLQNTSISLELTGGSGVPYSKQSNFTGTQLVDGGGQPSLLGSVNGARLPWQFRIDMQLSKDIHFKHKRKNGEKARIEKSTLNLTLSILNVFNTQNVLQVYRATGSSNDDGYLEAPQFQPFINGQLDPNSFRDLYRISANNPANLSVPRQIRLGARWSF